MPHEIIYHSDATVAVWKDTYSLYEAFVCRLKEKVPKNSVLIKTIADLLLLEKDSVYRRLRGNVPFTFTEVAIICNKMGISLDELINSSTEKDKLFQMRFMNYTNPSFSDYQSFDYFNEILASAKKTPNTEFAECSSMLPISIYLNFNYLTKYYLFKWEYWNSRNSSKSYSEVRIPKRLSQIYKDFLIHTKHISFTFFLWDNLIFQNLITEINYFRNLDLISQNEIQQIKDDLFRLLNHVQDLCNTGTYEETGNYVYIYISELNHETICSYLNISDIRVSMFKSLILNYITSTDNEVFDNLKKWMKSLLRSSTVISVSNEKERISFLEQQYKIINSL